MTAVFASSHDGVVLELEELERQILDDLAQQVIGLLEPDEAPPTDPLAAMVGIGTETELPDDPALARLLPDGFTDDPAASAEFRRFTEVGLRQRKVLDAQEVRRSLEAASPVRLDADQARRWLGFLNDVRLLLGTRLSVTEEPVELAEDDPRLPLFGLYGWLGVLQETLVESLTPRHP
ncbi:MAG TPA: DUF2017 domain-containing protein [Actinomycetes bacterium]|nr:DUF2017 domain-containing protein [Actinomycetes bacterium]